MQKLLFKVSVFNYEETDQTSRVSVLLSVTLYHKH